MYPLAQPRMMQLAVASPPLSEILRLMGYGAKPERAARELPRIEAVCREAKAVSAPLGAYLYTAADLPGSGFSEAHLGVGLVTIGAGPEGLAAGYTAQGRMFEALAADAFGSAMAEAAAEQLDRAMQVELCGHGKGCTARRSPGYGSFSLECQRAIFGLLPAAELGVALSDGLMMSPQKSISFAFGILDDPTAKRTAGCGACSLRECSQRRTVP